jgi:hypothetical protein
MAKLSPPTPVPATDSFSDEIETPWQKLPNVLFHLPRPEVADLILAFNLKPIFPIQIKEINMAKRKKSDDSVPDSPAPTAAAEALRAHMLKSFPTRKRRSNYTGPERPFHIDDKTDDDGWKWEISVGVLDTESPSLALLLHSVPQDEALVKFVHDRGGRVILKLEHASFVITLKPGDVQTIRQMAKLFRSLVTSRWQWLTKRTSDSLIRLADHLGQLPPTPLGP